MSLRIRLRRIGRKKQPSYRIVVMNSAAPRDGAYIDDVGFYNPRRQPAELRLDLERLDGWLGKGATLSTTAASLVRKARKGGDDKVGFQANAAVVEEPVAAAVPEKPKRTPRKPAAPGSTGTGAPPTEAAAPAEPVGQTPDAAVEAAEAPAEGAAE